MDRPIQRRLIRAIESLRHNPRPPGCRKLAGQEPGQSLYRIQEGDYRVIYDVRDRRLIVLVLHLGHRGDIYRQLRRG